MFYVMVKLDYSRSVLETKLLLTIFVILLAASVICLNLTSSSSLEGSYVT